MPRTARVVISDLSVHVVQRGHDRRACFFDVGDYLAYLDYLQFFAARFGCSVHAYCLMTNHVHLLMTPGTSDGCALLMKYLGQSYVQRINRKLKRTGTLWEGRFHSCLVGSEHYALACYRYIELNPVRAGLAGHPREYRWSSYAVNSQGQGNGFVRPHPAYLALADDYRRRGYTYSTLCETSLEDSVIEELRKATRGGYLVGAVRRRRGRPAVMRKMGSVPI